MKKQIRRRVADLTRLAYEHGRRDGVRSALAEIESIGAEDVIEQLGGLPAALEAIAETKAVKLLPARGGLTRAKSTGRKAAPKRAKSAGERDKPKSRIVQDALHTLLAAKGEARRDELLMAAQAENPKITKHDLNNGLRALTKRLQIRVAPDDSNRLLPA